jgi:hypothetical protein
LVEGEINDAMDRYNKRKIAAGNDPTKVSEQDMFRLSLSGTDIDTDELMSHKKEMISVAENAYKSGIPIGEIVFGMWVDGIVVGVEIEKART